MYQSKLEKQVEMGRLKEAVEEKRDLVYIAEMIDKSPGRTFNRIKSVYAGEESKPVVEFYQAQLDEWKTNQHRKNCTMYREINGITGYKSPRSRSTKLGYESGLSGDRTVKARWRKIGKAPS